MPNVIEFEPRRNDDDYRREIEDLLRNNYGEFTFQKVDGSVRIMRCTLLPSVIPETNRELKASARPGVATLFDVDIGEWRSLKYDNVMQFIYLGETPEDPDKESSWTQV